MIFSRGRRSAGRHARTDPRRARRAPDTDQERSLADELSLAEEQEAHMADQPSAPASPDPTPAAGPYDVAEAPEAVARLDLGSLQIPSVPGVQVRVQANQDGTVSRVVLVHGTSALQLAAFAAPRTEPIWDEVREEIRKSLFQEGVAVEETQGPYGGELRARVRTQEGLRDLRFVGVEGPRWLVRADFQGPAAVDPAEVPELLQCLRGLVVDRGNEARPVKEALPLKLSAKMAEQVQQQAAAARAARSAGGAGSSTFDTAPLASPTRSGGPTGQTAAPSAGRRKPSPRPRPRRGEGATGAGG